MISGKLEYFVYFLEACEVDQAEILLVWHHIVIEHDDIVTCLNKGIGCVEHVWQAAVALDTMHENNDRVLALLLGLGDSQ